MIDFTSFFITAILLTTLFIHIENKDKELTYVKSTVDDRKYLVRNLPDKQQSADMIATVRGNLVKLSQELKNKNEGNIHINRMINNFNPNNIVESEKSNKFTSYSINKGEKTVYCLRSRDDKNKIVELNTMMFVALHELAHTMTKSIGHTKEFWDNFRILLRNAIRIKIYKRINYNENPVKYCGVEITDDPMNFD
jgi:predicted metal-dependent hydrolase|uniref:WLM domain-containing protein n=1 Tax=viral metagenome TaxID=1070528 RepID=A0A6C0J938_9ZZZZ